MNQDIGVDSSPEQIREFYLNVYSVKNKNNRCEVYKNICESIIQSDWMTYDKEDNDHTITISVEQFTFFKYLYEKEMYEYAVEYACENHWEIYLLCNYDEIYSNF